MSAEVQRSRQTFGVPQITCAVGQKESRGVKREQVLPDKDSSLWGGYRSGKVMRGKIP